MRPFSMLSLAILIAELTGGVQAVADEKIPQLFLQQPVYDRAMRLADGIAAADLVVVGTAVHDDGLTGRMQVHDTLFGQPHKELLDADGTLALEKKARVAWDHRGVWLLVRSPQGYLSLNPSVEPLERGEYNQLPRPPKHWTEQTDLVCQWTGKHQLYYTYIDPATGRDTLHGPNCYTNRSGEITFAYIYHGEPLLYILWDSQGRVDRVTRKPAKGHGFFLDFDGDRVVWFQNILDRKIHGLERRYYRERPTPPRLEKHYTHGVIDGRFRQWNSAGKLVSDVTYELGLISPIVRYKGTGNSGITLLRTSDGAVYSYSPVALQVTVGMTERQVSDLITVDFSPASGIRFPGYRIDEYLHIAFENGVVSKISTGHNGACPELVD